MNTNPVIEESAIYTFYSYKGGVGRSMAVANVGALLSRWGYKVLIVDWDLEAPGIEKYFEASGLSASRTRVPGMLDIIEAHANESSLHWQSCLITSDPFRNDNPVSIITAGQDTPSYAGKLQQTDWNDLVENHRLGPYLNRLRDEWLEEFDFVLVDSRTGINDIGGICTIILPDVLVLMFTTNEQSIDGVADVMRRARRGQNRLPDDRGRLIAVPVLARDESQNEYEQSRRWRDRIANKLGEFYKDWIVKEMTPGDVLRKLYIPYWAYWSFGERLPVVEAEDELEDPSKLGAAYSRLALLISNELDWNAVNRLSDPSELLQQRAETQDEARRADRAESANRKWIASASILPVIVLTWTLYTAILPTSTDDLLQTLYQTDAPPQLRTDTIEQLQRRNIGNLDNLNISGLALTEFVFPGVSLRNARLEGLRADYLNLANADLSGSNLSGLSAARIDLSGAILVDVDLESANLMNADLTNADLRGADLRDANLRGADLSGAKVSDFTLNPGGYNELFMDANTVLPDGTKWGSP